jgi:hypothetical protein
MDKEKSRVQRKIAMDSRGAQHLQMDEAVPLYQPSPPCQWKVDKEVRTHWRRYLPQIMKVGNEIQICDQGKKQNV